MRTRRRRDARHRFRRALGGEALEPRRVMAVSVLTPLPDVSTTAGSAPATIALVGRYDDPAVGGTVVRFATNLGGSNGAFFVELFDAAAPGRTRVTPVTTTNFLRYVDGGHYANTFIHRSVPGFVVQGGGFNLPASGPLQIGDVTNFGQIVNEPGPVGTTNIRGTIAMAKLGGNPDSASNQWFFNLTDNTDPLNPNSLDNQNGGFTTFGRVLGTGMSTVDAIADLDFYNLSGGDPQGVFAAVPLQGIPNPVPADFALALGNFLVFPSISRVAEVVYTVSSSAPSLVTPSIQPDGSLRIVSTPGAAGTATVTVRATSAYDPTSFVDDAFMVTVTAPEPETTAAPNALVGLAGDGLTISRSTGTSFTTDALATLPAGGGWTTLLTGDFDGDGRDDVAARSAAGAWWVVRTPASGPAAAPTTWGSLSTTISWRTVVGDFTGDSRADIAAFNPATGVWRLLASDGSAFTSARFGSWNPAGQWQSLTVGDFDGDGRADIAARSAADGGWWVGRSTGTALTTTRWATTALTAAWQSIRAGDFDGDGRTDIAGRVATSGSWRVLTSTGSAFTNRTFGSWDTDSSWTTVQVGDFDGDGRDDIAGRRVADGAWWVGRSTGTAFTSAPWATLSTTVTWKDAVVGDFDGDGRHDIATRHGTTGVWRVLVSTGSAFTNTRFGAWAASLAASRAQGVRA